MQSEQIKKCPSCEFENNNSANFCSKCGFKFKEPDLNTSFAKQVLIYFVSFFLAPFGLIYAAKYIKQNNPRAKKIAWASIVLTIVSIILMLWLGYASTKAYIELLNNLLI